MREPLSWLKTDWLLGYFGDEKPWRAYKRFVDAKIGLTEDDPLKKAGGTAMLGSDEFIQKMRDKYLKRAKDSRDLPALKELTRRSMDDIIGAVQSVFRGDATLRKKAALYVAHRYGGLSLKGDCRALWSR